MYGAFCKNFCELCNKLPQLDIGAEIPLPRKLRALSTIIDEAIAAVEAVMVVGRMDGKI